MTSPMDDRDDDRNRIVRPPGSPPPVDRYGYSLFVSFPNSGDLGTLDEEAWIIEQHHRIDGLLIAHGAGVSDGWGRGMGQLDVTCFVTDMQRAAQLIVEELTDDELIAWVVVKGSMHGSGVWQVIYPAPLE